MSKLEQLIAGWREQICAAPGIDSETVNELETHLRESIEQSRRAGIDEAEAFRRAAAQVGSADSLSSEFAKLDQRLWFPIKAAITIGIVVGVLLTIFLIARPRGSQWSLLLNVHVFTVTLGYGSTYLLGAIGICYVGQRCFCEFNPGRQQSIARATSSLASVAAGLTGIAIVLGAIWAKLEWGRFWAWDPKETTGIGVLVWLTILSLSRPSGLVTTRGLMLLAVLANVIVTLAWFGPNLLHDLHSYGHAWNLILMLMISLQLAFFLIGLAPAGCLRRRKLVG